LPTSISDDSRIDAIIVPTARPSAQLHNAIDYAKQLRCALVVLCSQKSTTSDVAKLTRDDGIDVIAIDIDGIPKDLLPGFGTTDLLNSRRRFRDVRDTPAKRNLGLVFAALVGWQRVFFLDDDITVDHVDVLRAAVRQLDHYEVAGLRVDEFPDNSVVCHAGRALGRPQQTFIGGGALAVDVTAAAEAFFPQVYNEDWFYLLNDKGLRPIVVAGKARQQQYDPYYSPRRARFEEVGDTLAEGVFWLLDEDGKVNDATPKHWQRFLSDRRAFILDLLGAVDTSDLPVGKQRKIRAALAAALRRNQRISAEFCADYVTAWHADRETWRARVGELRAAYDKAASTDLWAPRKALTVLGLDRCSNWVHAESKQVKPKQDEPRSKPWRKSRSKQARIPVGAAQS
jgi:hypothetical protein